MTDQQNESYIRGLLQERDYAKAKGDDAQVEAVNAQLKLVGFKLPRERAVRMTKPKADAEL